MINNYFHYYLNMKVLLRLYFIILLLNVLIVSCIFYTKVTPP